MFIVMTREAQFIALLQTDAVAQLERAEVARRLLPSPRSRSVSGCDPQKLNARPNPPVMRFLCEHYGMIAECSGFWGC